MGLRLAGLGVCWAWSTLVLSHRWSLGKASKSTEPDDCWEEQYDEIEMIKAITNTTLCFLLIHLDSA